MPTSPEISSSTAISSYRIFDTFISNQTISFLAMKKVKLTPQQLGVLARKNMADRLDKRLLVFVNENPGLSVYDLSKKVKRHPSTIHSAVSRLSFQHLVATRTVLRKEGKIKRVYPPSFKFGSLHEVVLPKQAIRIGNPTWQQAYIYKLSAESIGFAGERVPDWDERSEPIVQAPEHSDDGSMRVHLPDEIYNFYDLDRKETLLAYINNKAILTVTGSIE